ncbi:uncharacterized protein K452DRAFT_282748 [Aplosporella prunicola CBS 121167]|uniref:MYND-type domain-containing protein n=1 Tax=Aplosporella prunicola CBS 121167 TaxID=1176127 RepID=A0A6A6BR56_9PEZI|nr:uncharacterized protein K452DRAFT_282748 [Aplosporella prunicola CBS 121167]KAF2146566.1 hypothetical protein K452DRAFT_282748 [Aplosporella prunicola CBS 121167]
MTPGFSANNNNPSAERALEIMAQNNASYIKESPVAGNGLFAKKAIDTGGLIFSIPRPLVAALDTSRLLDTCANCFACNDMIGSSEGLDLKACTGCNIVKFCGKACQTDSWKRAHKFECPVFRELERSGRLPNAVRAGMELLARRKNGRLSDAQWDELMRLETHLDDLRARDDWETHEVLAMGVLKYSKTEGTFDVETAQGVYARVRTA